MSQPIKAQADCSSQELCRLLEQTSSGIEPIFCAAFKRRYLKGQQWLYQYVVDPTSKRLLDVGMPLANIEDAYTLAENVERRLAFQAWVQNCVDHAISSTINLPAWGTRSTNEGRLRDFGNTLMKYLPQLRGVTVYPDGARAGQPINPVGLEEAIGQAGEVFVEAGDACELSGGECVCLKSRD